MFRTILLIGAGSLVGGIARYLLSRAIQTGAGSGFPWGTFVVNVTGCLIIGIMYGLFEKETVMNPDTRLFLTVGLCGGFTTFSTFIHENYNLFTSGNFLQSGIYSVSSFALGLCAAYLGHYIVKIL